jgi:hypothetical protein
MRSADRSEVMKELEELIASIEDLLEDERVIIAALEKELEDRS